MQSITQNLGRHLNIFRKPEASAERPAAALPVTVESFSRGNTPGVQNELDKCKWAIANRPQLHSNQQVPQMEALSATRLTVLQKDGVRQAIQISSSLLGSAGAALHFGFKEGQPTATLHHANGRTSKLPAHLNEKGAVQARLPNGNTVAYSATRNVGDVTFSSENDTRASAKYILEHGTPFEPAPQHTSLDVTRHDGGLTTLMPNSTSFNNAAGSRFSVDDSTDRLYGHWAHPSDTGSPTREPGSHINPLVHHVVSTLIPARDSALHQLNTDFPVASAPQTEGWLTSIANKLLR